MTSVPTPLVYKIPSSVLVVIYTPDQQVLLIERADEAGGATGFWQSVTGSLDALDEPPLLAAQREVWEETRQPACVLSDWQLENIYDIYPRWRYRYAPGVARNTERVFGLQVLIDTPVRLNAREHVAYQWLPYRTAADLCTSASNAEAVLLLPQMASLSQ
jgi:dihydroneopterin triphosphate diphosphatase